VFVSLLKNMNQDYRQFAVELAQAAGEIIKDNFVLGMKKEWKQDATPLTVTDTKINQMVIDAVKTHFPDHSVLAEEGAMLNNEPIRVSERTMVKESLIGIVYWKNAPFDFSQFTEVIRNEQAKIMVIASIAYMASLVACGEFVATLFPGDRPHDSAALKIIIEEAGGRVTDVYGNEQRYDRAIQGHIASNGVLHDQFVELVRNTVLNQKKV